MLLPGEPQAATKYPGESIRALNLRWADNEDRRWITEQLQGVRTEVSELRAEMQENLENLKKLQDRSAHSEASTSAEYPNQQSTLFELNDPTNSRHSLLSCIRVPAVA